MGAKVGDWFSQGQVSGPEGRGQFLGGGVGGELHLPLTYEISRLQTGVFHPPPSFIKKTRKSGLNHRHHISSRRQGSNSAKITAGGVGTPVVTPVIRHSTRWSASPSSRRSRSLTGTAGRTEHCAVVVNGPEIVPDSVKLPGLNMVSVTS